MNENGENEFRRLPPPEVKNHRDERHGVKITKVIPIETPDIEHKAWV